MANRVAGLGFVAACALVLAGCPVLVGLDKDFRESDDGSSPQIDGASGADAEADSASGLDGGMATDGGADASSDALTDATPVGPPGTLPCGPGLTCAPPATTCCFNATSSSSCISSGSVCTNGTAIACHVAAECGAGMVCCAEVSGSSVQRVICRGAGSCAIGSTSAILCDPDIAGACPSPYTCQPTTLSGIPKVYYQCR